METIIWLVLYWWVYYRWNKSSKWFFGVIAYVCHEALYHSASFGNDVWPIGARFLKELAMVFLGYVKSIDEKSVVFNNMYNETGSYV